MTRILQIDGGGVRGIIPAIICAEIEQNVGRPINEIFDLITGTSTGAVIGGSLAFGIAATTVRDLYLTAVPELFKRRPLWNPKNWFREKYDRTEFQEQLRKYLGNQKMSQAKTKYMATAFNLSSQRTHFIKSWDDKDNRWNIVDVISWSALSAAFYFGKINVPNYNWTLTNAMSATEQKIGATFQDGGQGISNCTLGFDLDECLANDWHDVFILSIGTGQRSMYIPYKKTAKTGYIAQVIDYIFQARNEATPTQFLTAKYVANKREDYILSRLDANISKKQEPLDSIKYVDEYEKIGNELAKKVPYQYLKSIV